MLLATRDFNAADKVIAAHHSEEWGELNEVLAALPLHLKASDQAGLQGNPIFDVVGTNEFIHAELVRRGWRAKIPIPRQYSFLGTDVDFGKNGMVVEVQFSNYPFLLNNTIRGELFFKSETVLAGKATDLVVIVTKAKMFPASNSTLYYEQGVNQLDELARHKVFDVPIRLVGLFEKEEGVVPVRWTEYHNPRYSRTVTNRTDKRCEIRRGGGPRSRGRLRVID